MIPSPKVATYDKKPEMSVQAVADKVAEVVKTGEYEFVMCNFAPPDMVRLFARHSSYSRSATLVSTMRPSRPLPRPTRPLGPSTTHARRPATCSASPPTTATRSR